jgi:hypothetical protein
MWLIRRVWAAAEGGLDRSAAVGFVQFRPGAATFETPSTVARCAVFVACVLLRHIAARLRFR